MEFHDYAIEALINSDICRGYKDYLLGELRKAEKIVTCKDCIHRDEYGCRHGHPNCKDNFYCADGERRE